MNNLAISALGESGDKIPAWLMGTGQNPVSITPLLNLRHQLLRILGTPPVKVTYSSMGSFGAAFSAADRN